MKPTLIILTFFVPAMLIAQAKDSLTKTFYASGLLKSTGTYNKKGQKNGQFIYYSEEGKIDSSMLYKNGKLEGEKIVYYLPDDIFHFAYYNNKLQSHKVFDSSGSLKYEAPLNSKQIPKTTFYFTSGRSFYKTGTIDTLVINKDVPFMNLNVYFPGATTMAIGRYSWAIKQWKPQPNTTTGKLVVDISQFNIEGIPETATIKSKSVRHEVLMVPIN